MTSLSVGESPERKKGRVARIAGSGDFGFISSDDVPGQDVYFKMSWFRGVPALQVGDGFTFELNRFGDSVQAHALARAGDETPSAAMAAAPLRGAPATDWLLNWAYLGYLPRVQTDLRGLALPRADRAQRHPLGPALLGRVGHGDGLLVDIETDVQALARLTHG